MKERILYRVMVFSLALCVFISLFTASAFAANPVVNTAASLADVFKSAVNSVVDVGEVAADAVDKAANMVSFRFSLNRTDLVSPEKFLEYGDEFNSLDWLYAALSTNNSLFQVYEQAKANLANTETGRPKLIARPDPNTSYNTIRYYIDGYGWLVDSNGNYPYCDTAEYNTYVNGAGGNTPAVGKVLPTNKWVDVRSVDIKILGGTLLWKQALCPGSLPTLVRFSRLPLAGCPLLWVPLWTPPFCWSALPLALPSPASGSSRPCGKTATEGAGARKRSACPGSNPIYHPLQGGFIYDLPGHLGYPDPPLAQAQGSPSCP